MGGSGDSLVGGRGGGSQSRESSPQEAMVVSQVGLTSEVNTRPYNRLLKETEVKTW